MTDLFESMDELPKKVQKIIFDFYWEEQTFKACEELLVKLEAEGYTFEVGLDAVPFNLTKKK